MIPLSHRSARRRCVHGTSIHAVACVREPPQRWSEDEEIFTRKFPVVPERMPPGEYELC